MLTWLTGPRIVIYGVLALAFLAGGYVLYLHVKHVGYEEAVAEYKAQAFKVNTQRAAVAAPIVAKEQKAQEKIRTVTQTIIKEVPTYVKADDCVLSGGFRVLHDAAADGSVPDSARVADAAPVPAQTAASTIAENYGTCLQNAQRLTSLQEWVQKQVDLK